MSSTLPTTPPATPKEATAPRCPLHALFTRRSTPSAEPLSVRLKTLTQPQHDETERHPLQTVIFGSEGPARAREAYTRLLGQQLRIQGAFEPLLCAAGREGGPLAPVVRPHHFHLDALRADLEALRVPEAWRTPLPATERFAAAIASCAEDADGEGAWRLLGVFYVFEGSTNGGTVIGKRIAEQLGLPADPASALAPAGTRFTNPHGRQVRPRWTAWKEAVDALGLDEPAAEAAVASAREAFERTREVFEDVRLAMGDAAPR